MSDQKNHAIVFGASGINGWALTNQLLSGYQSPDTFSKITAISHRPFVPEDAGWPKDDRLQIITGIDLLEGDHTSLQEVLKEKVSSVDTVTHLYFAGERIIPHYLDFIVVY